MEQFREVILEAESIGVSDFVLPKELLDFAESEKFAEDRIRSAFLLGMAFERIGGNE